MGMRFGKSIRMGKSFRLNLSTRGIGMSVGVPGYRVGIGPRGGRVTVGIPGTGISWSQGFGGSNPHRRATAAGNSVPMLPVLKNPGLFAPVEEKAFVRGWNAYIQQNHDDALVALLPIAGREMGAGLLCAIILAARDGEELGAIGHLNRILETNTVFPSRLMDKYFTDLTLPMQITPNVYAHVHMDALGVSILLAEIYQSIGMNDAAIGVLEEAEEVARNPLLSLSLCELYAAAGHWDGVIERGKSTQPTDDVGLETLVYYGRALREKGLLDGAIQVFSDALRRKKDRSAVLLREAKYWRALSLQESGKLARAKKDFEELYADDPDYRDVSSRIHAKRAESLTAGNPASERSGYVRGSLFTSYVDEVKNLKRRGDLEAARELLVELCAAAQQHALDNGYPAEPTWYREQLRIVERQLQKKIGNDPMDHD